MASAYITQKQPLAHVTYLLMCLLLIMYIHTYCEFQNMSDYIATWINTYIDSDVFQMYFANTAINNHH